VLKKISRELLVPDFFLFAEAVPISEVRFPDFRLSKPAQTGYARETLQWMDLAASIQSQAQSSVRPDPALGLKAAIGLTTRTSISAAAQTLRARLGFTFELQTEARDARALFAWLRRQIETLNVFVLQLSFHEKDGAGFCLTSDHHDVIVLNTRKQFQMLGVFAEFERGIIRERVNAGLARARANGTKLGRRRVKPSVEARILELRASGDGILKIGKKLGIGTSVVQRVFKQDPRQP
jgi:hypothetical protein